MKIENTQVSNIESAIRGMRNPLKSWNKSDSVFGICRYWDEADKMAKKYTKGKFTEKNISELSYRLEETKNRNYLLDNGVLSVNEMWDDDGYEIGLVAYIGPNDMKLAKQLISAGSSHRKFLRQITVSFDITASIAFFKQFDTYKIGTVSNSTSTMHTLTKEPIRINKFEDNNIDYEDLLGDDINGTLLTYGQCEHLIRDWIAFLEMLRIRYNTTGNKEYFNELIRWLPESYLQKRTITTNYEVIKNICEQRKGHKMKEWEKFIEWAKELPYAEDFIFPY